VTNAPRCSPDTEPFQSDHQNEDFEMNILYRTDATAIGGRNGSAATADGSLRISLAAPAQLGGDGRVGNNPEQLFATGYAACFLEGIKIVAARSRTPIANDASVTARVELVEGERGEGTTLKVGLTIDLPGLDDDLANRLMLEAHRTCPYSNATRGNVDVRLGLA
jgi:osmotically inducible protein OsmC